MRSVASRESNQMQVQRLEVRLVYMAKSGGLESPRNPESPPMPEHMKTAFPNWNLRESSAIP
jgi:hypothetical protein